MTGQGYTPESVLSQLPVRSVAFGPDGAVLASGGDDSSVRLWSLTEDDQIGVLGGTGGPVSSVAFGPDGAVLACGSDDGTVRLWDAATGRERSVLEGHVGPVRSVAFGPDGAVLASGGDDSSVRLWSLTEDDQIGVLGGTGGPVSSVAFGPDGAVLACGSDDGTVRLWDAATGRERSVLEGHVGPVRSVAFGPDGAVLASGGDDSSVRLWSLTEDDQIGVLGGTGGPVSSVAFGPDGAVLASGSDDGTVRLWDAATGRERSVLEGHVGPVRSVAFGPDGAVLASGGNDETIRVWDTTTGVQIHIYRGKPTAFISYSWPDRPIADRLRRALSNAGLAVWSDEKIPVGASIAGSVEEAIRQADAVFVIVSPSARESPYATAELAIAIAERGRNARKVVVPVLVGSERDIPPLLRDIAGFDIESDDIERRLAILAQTLRSRGVSSLQRTSYDRGAQLDLIEAERLSINRRQEAHDISLASRELGLRKRLFVSAIAAVVISMAIVAAFFALTHRDKSAEILTTANLTVGVTVAITALMPLITSRRESSDSALPDRSNDDHAR